MLRSLENLQQTTYSSQIVLGLTLNQLPEPHLDNFRLHLHHVCLAPFLQLRFRLGLTCIFLAYYYCRSSLKMINSLQAASLDSIILRCCFQCQLHVISVAVHEMSELNTFHGTSQDREFIHPWISHGGCGGSGEHSTCIPLGLNRRKSPVTMARRP